MRTAVLLGIGTAGTFDKVVFHQLLGWHHLYDRAALSLAAPAPSATGEP